MSITIDAAKAGVMAYFLVLSPRLRVHRVTKTADAVDTDMGMLSNRAH
jgi:hypothetical protein